MLVRFPRTLSRRTCEFTFVPLLLISSTVVRLVKVPVERAILLVLELVLAFLQAAWAGRVTAAAKVAVWLGIYRCVGVCL